MEEEKIKFSPPPFYIDFQIYDLKGIFRKNYLVFLIFLTILCMSVLPFLVWICINMVVIPISPYVQLLHQVQLLSGQEDSDLLFFRNF